MITVTEVNTEYRKNKYLKMRIYAKVNIHLYALNTVPVLNVTQSIKPYTTMQYKQSS
uniref:Uncharacterized protein n=1 Tax=Anguilla anguilla TaxID=7936 RepID=A0A0E9Q6W7_ANGAN